MLLLCATALLGLGVLMVQSAGMRIDRPMDHEPWLSLLWTRHTLYAGLAIAAMLAASWINARQLFRIRSVINPLHIGLILSLVLVGLTLIPGVGLNVNGASRWLAIGPIRFQPSELVKWMMPIALAWWCARRRGVIDRYGPGLLPPLALLGIACVLVAKEDLGTGVLIGTVGLIMLAAGGARLTHLASLIPAAAVGLTMAIITTPYRIQRLLTFWDPWADPAGTGYHPIQSMLAFAQGGLLGRGLGGSIQKYHLPEDTTDFLFPIICEELGIAGAMLVIGLYVVMLWTMFSVARQCKDGFGRLLAMGVMATIGLQAAINLAVVTVMAPTKGIALPLLSAGGTGWVMTAFAIGLVASLDNAKAIMDDDGSLPGDLPQAELDNPTNTRATVTHINRRRPAKAA